MHKQQGITLVELMISITLGLILMGGVIQMFVASKQTFSTQQGLSRVQETGRLATEMMARDIRMAGYMGCGGRQLAENAQGGGGYCSIPGSPGCITNGLNDHGDEMLDFTGPAIRGYTAANAPATIGGGDINAGTDLVVVRSAGDSSFSLNQPSGQSANLDVIGTEIGGCIGDICIGDVLLLSDCSQGRSLQATNIKGVGNTGNLVNFVHSIANVGGPGNSSPNWGKVQEFDTGAEIFKVSNIAYFIDNNDQGRPSLMRQVNNRPAVQLLEGVEDMHLSYSEAGSAIYNDWSAGTDWDTIASVRIRLLVRSEEDHVVPEPQTYTWRGAEVTAEDRRMYQVFTTTVGARSRLP